MIHYTCDGCKREIDPQETRVSLRIEVSAALDPTVEDERECADDRDHLDEVQNILESIDQLSNEEANLYEPSERLFDLCAECARRFLKNPLNREPVKQFDFSQN